MKNKIFILIKFWILINNNSILCKTLEFMSPKQYGALSTRFLNEMKEIFDINCFIETGTAGGSTTLIAANIFSEVYTIELLKRFYETNLSKFANYSNVKAFLGSSDKILPKILCTDKVKNQACLFFLDAHYCGGNIKEKGETNTPLEKEIQLIMECCPNSVILIDDLRLCQQEELSKLQYKANNDDTVIGYPSFSQIQKLLKTKKYNLFAFGDIGLAYPEDKYRDIEVSLIIKTMTNSRLFDEKNSHTQSEIENIIKEELQFLNIKESEYLVLKDLISPINNFLSVNFLSAHYRLWNTIALLGQKDFKNARKDLQHIKSLGLMKNRIDYYLDNINNLLNKGQNV